jgi:hypothetical protein
MVLFPAVEVVVVVVDLVGDTSTFSWEFGRKLGGICGSLWDYIVYNILYIH